MSDHHPNQRGKSANSGKLDAETGKCYEDLGTPHVKAPEVSSCDEEGYDEKVDQFLFLLRKLLRERAKLKA
ncbi:hypothetical protein XENTR_v10019233 [Xenopus tropicalis]|nr:hypothetical protein XENTR_v10019233 [Xenopus tropicalis]